MNSSKIIFHIDMNCFFASCEIAQNEELAGKPIAIAHSDPLKRSIILSPSYEARKFGIKTTMLVRDAMLLCNELIVVEPDMALYQQYSKLFFDYLYTITDKIEIASIDEGYLDVTQVCEKIHPLDLANQIQKHLLDEYRLPCSIGIAPNKFLAKMASDMKKPLGITVLRKREIDKYLWPLSISEMYGVGKKTAPKLNSIGIATIGDLANYPNLELLMQTVGEITAKGLIERANGIDNTEIDSGSFNEASSVSNSHTFDNDVYDASLLKKTFRVIANTVANRLKKAFQKAYTIGIQLKYNDFRLINRSRGLDTATNDEYTIFSVVEDLFEEYYRQGDQIRLIGVFANRLVQEAEEIKQYSIFDDLSSLEKDESITKLLADVRNHFGKESINRGFYKYQKKDE